MSERSDITAAIERMGSKLGARRELKALPGELAPGETVHRITSGMYRDGTGILVATDRRLLFLLQGLMRQVNEDFTYDKISSVEYKGGALLASVVVYVSNQKAEITHVAKPEAKAIVDETRARIASTVAPASPPADTAGPTVHEQLLKLKELLDAGIIDTPTYEAKRDHLVAQL